MKPKEENVNKFAEILFSLAQAFKTEAENCAKMCGDSSEKEMAVIFFVGQNKNVKMSDIADTIVAPMSTLTNVVDKLVEKKLLNRNHSGEDRRVINVSLSDMGKSTYEKLVEKRRKLAEAILSGLNEKEQALITKHLQILSREIGINK
jgi:DNA-binding MarR family transcriptional regulator